MTNLAYKNNETDTEIKSIDNGQPFTPKVSAIREYLITTLAREISRMSKYFDEVVQWLPRSNDSGELLTKIECSNKSLASDQKINFLNTTNERRSLVLLNGNINHIHDIQGLFENLKLQLTRHDRLLLVAYNPYYEAIYKLANKLGFRRGEIPDTFVTMTDLENICELSGFEVTRVRPALYFPHFLGIGDFLNAWLPSMPLIRWLALTCLVTIRPVIKSIEKPSLSVIIPARNEKGNIENALIRLEEFSKNVKLEIVFVEGNSNDGTWEEILRVAELYKDKFNIQTLKQTGKGKGDAVRLGFSKSQSELVTILDADLTMPPELLHRFYEAYTSGKADFINGSRLVYPMEGQAMRFLNNLGNKFFAKALSYVLDTLIGDSLCGTKLLSKIDYDRMTRWRNDFGDFDPFGDFELLFPAAQLGMGVIDVPIRYRDRTYGTTNINRFRHGWMLLKMTAIGFLRIKRN
jgi:hypothetical protein